MKQIEALKILQYYNKWRRGENVHIDSPRKIGEAIDIAIESLKVFAENKKEKKMYKKVRSCPSCKSKAILNSKTYSFCLGRNCNWNSLDYENN